MKNLDWALKYAALGWPIIPLHYVLSNGQCSCKQQKCNRIGKHPVGPLTKEGLKNASTDPTVIRAWWDYSPHLNIGYATGADGHIVMDVDAGPGKVGPKTLKALTEAAGELPKTLLAKTGGGGFHYHFLTPLAVKNSQDQVGRNLDVRGRGGYVVLPPSNHASGNKYEWITDIDQTPVAELPEWLGKKMVGPLKFERAELQPEIIKHAKESKREPLTPEQIVRLLDFIPPDCDRETWWKVGAALKVELGETRGWEAWRNWSMKWEPTDPKKGWNETTSLSQWESFEAKGVTAGTIFKLAKDHGFRGFNRETADLPEVKDEWVYVIGIKRFVETSRMMQLDKEQYDARFAPLFEKGAPSNHVLRNEAFRRFDAVTYWPKRPLIVTEEGEEKLNIWRPIHLEPSAGDCRPLLEHVAYLYPDKREADILLDYLAFQVQFPGEKVHWSLLMQGVQGTGKSYFGEVLKVVLGEHNVRTVTNEMLHEPYTGWIAGKQFIIVEEMMAGKRLELMNKLKPMITEKWLSIREMYKPPYEQVNRVNFLFLTNHTDPIIIDETDRRYCVLNSSAPPNPEAGYYARLFDWTRTNPGVILDYLQSRTLTIEPKGHAPMTSGKVALIRESMTALQQTISDAVTMGAYPFNEDLIFPAELPAAMKDTKVNSKELKRAFQTLGFKKLDDAGFVWSIRNHHQYGPMSFSEVHALTVARTTGAPVEAPTPANVTFGIGTATKNRKPI